MKPLRFHRYLTPNSFESVCYRASLTTKEAQGWTEETKRNGILIDLSRVEFAEFSALAQIALFVEGAARHGIFVTVALPLARPRRGEQKFIEECHKSRDIAKRSWSHHTEKRIFLRKNSLSFMRRCGFQEAIKVSHVPDSGNLVEIDFDYDSGVEDRNDNLIAAKMSSIPKEFSQNEKEEYYLSRIFPLNWFTPMSGADLLRSENFAVHVLAFESMGLKKSEAEGIVGTVFSQLVENVHYYAKETGNVKSAPYALIGAIVLDPEKYVMRLANFRPCLRYFVRWAVKAKSSTVRIIVGDSGSGIPRVLGPYFLPENQDEVPQLDQTDKPLRQAEKILLWSFHRWSTSNKEGALLKRGTRGLWLVQTFVGSNHGAITIRAADAMVGWRYQDFLEPALVRDQNLRFIPGTLLDVCLLPQFTIPFRARSTHIEKSQCQITFSSVRCHENENAGISEEDVKQLVQQLGKATPNDHRCVIAIVSAVAPHPRLAQDFLIDILNLSSKIANPGALVLICPGVSHVQIKNAIDSIDISREDLEDAFLSRIGMPKRANPVMVIDAKGEAIWFGGTAAIRRFLYALSNGEEFHLSEQDENQTDFYRELRKLQDLIHQASDGSLQLRFLSDDVNNWIIEEVGSKLRDMVNNVGRNILQGLFRTPSLQYVNRWLNVEQVLKQETDIRLSAYALARRLEMAGYADKRTEIFLVRVDTASAEIANKLSDSLGISRTPLPLPGELDAFTPPDVPRIRKGTKVIICADLVLSGYALKRAISYLLRWEVEPIAAACIYDARKDKVPFVPCLDRKVPLVSLAQVDILASEPVSIGVKDIDPVLREPTTKNIMRIEPEYEIPPKELLQWLQERDGIVCLGHIERSIGRHFLTYLNAKKLIQKDSPHREKILDNFVKYVVEWAERQKKENIPGIQNQKMPFEVWYPEPASDFAGQIAIGVVEKLSKSYPKIHVAHLRGIPRAVCGGRWVFPRDVERVRGDAHVVIVDWGSITALTVQQLMRLAAESGAASIQVIVFLSQMPTEDELFLRGLPSFKRFKLIEDLGTIQRAFAFFDENAQPMERRPKVEEEIIPARVTFLSSLRLGHYQSADCPICRVRQSLEKEEELCPTELLCEHSKKTSLLLKEREREEVFTREPQADLFDAALTGEDIAKIIELRQQLDAALRSTQDRNRIRSNLLDILDGQSIGQSQQGRIAWVRMLAAEPVWLKLPPLRFDELRELVGRIALGIAAAEPVESIDPRIRRQAIIVLRAASKEKFVKELPKLVESCINDKSLVQQLLYDTFTYLLKPYHEFPATIEKLLASLERCRSYLQGIAAKSESYVEYLYTVNSLIQTSQFLESRSGLKNLTTREIWRILSERYKEPMKSHHPVIRKMITLYIPFQPPLTTTEVPNKEVFRNALDLWEECNAFLSTHVLPCLPPLKSIFLGDHFSSQMELSQLDFFASLTEGNIPYQGGRLKNLLYEFFQNPGLILRPDKIEKFNQLYELWERSFLRGPGEKDRPTLQPALLLKFLESCPSNLKNAIEYALQETKPLVPPFGILNKSFSELDFKVFCPGDLLRDAIGHIIVNAAADKHANPQRCGEPQIYFNYSNGNEAEDTIVLKILNTGTIPCDLPGQKLASLDRKLRPFEGHLHGRISDGTTWTYETQLKFIRW